MADKLGLPGIGLSNFTWHYIFINLFSETENVIALRMRILRVIWPLFSPFNEDMNLFKKKLIGLMSRDVYT